MASAPVLEVRNIVQQFPAVRALNGVSLTFRSGEVHGVVGENGAGKSTLMRVLAGLQVPTSGEVLVSGQPVSLRSVRQAESLGMVMIHQELNLVDQLSVAENVFLGREPRRGLTIDRRTMSARTRTLLEQVGATFSPETPVAELSLAAKQLVEIAKALSHDAKLIIMDEPTAVLSQNEVRALFGVIADLRERGVAVVYISHILSELLDVCDRITVMRDGAVVGEVPAKEATAPEIANMMVGRELGDFFPPKYSPPAEAPRVLWTRDLVVAGSDAPAELALNQGEIVGIAGLIGSGRTELGETIAGLRRPLRGTVGIEGEDRSKIAYVSEDRKGAGLVLEMSTVENVTMVSLGRYARFAVDRKQTRNAADQWISNLDIRVGDVDAPVRFLSGGNQQKVSIAKWLETGPKVLILDEPTRGVDVGAKREIYRLIQNLAAEGMACLVISSEMNELIGLCQRILVMRKGSIVAQLSGREMTEANIMRHAAGVDSEPVAATIVGTEANNG